MFGEQHLGDTGHAGNSRAAAMADTAEVCGCNGVKKGTIVKAIREQGLFTLDEVRKCTKASGSCGSCTGLVEQILMMTAGAGYTAAPKLKPVCGCTDANHQQVRDAIREQHLLTIAERLRAPRLAHAERLRQLPAGDQLLPHQHLAARGARRSAVALHQRARRTPTSRRTAPSRSCRGCGPARPARRSCGASPTSSTSTRSRPSRSPAASASTCSA